MPLSQTPDKKELQQQEEKKKKRYYSHPFAVVICEEE